MSYITFIDSIGRNILGTNTAENSDTITVENPVMIAVQPNGNGQLQVQLVPLFFAEFIKYDENKKRNFKFRFNKCSIIVGDDFDIDLRIIDQYEKVLKGTFQADPQPLPVSPPDTIKLFDE